MNELTESENLEFGLVTSVSLRVKFFITGVVFPIICIGCAVGGMPASSDSPWQSGTLSTYVTLLLQWPAIGAFIPLIVYSMACLAAWTVRPSTGESVVVTIGLYAGVLLAIQFQLFVVCSTFFVTLLAAAFVGPTLALVVYAIRVFVTRVRRFSIRHLLILTTGCAVASLLLKFFGSLESVMKLGVAIFVLVVAATPTLSLITYLRVALAMDDQLGVERSQTNWWPVWGWQFFGAAWFTSWKIALDIMLAEYAKLPTNYRSNCYVSSAAAHGHQCLVGSDISTSCAATVMLVNSQTRRLKFLELALAAACPRLYRSIRRVYDRIGPMLARGCCRNVWFADVTYLVLKPLEWAAEGVRIAAQVPEVKVRGLYGDATRGGRESFSGRSIV